MPELIHNPHLPWEPESLILGNLAIGNLRENMLIWFKVNGIVHVETLLTAIGALAGFAAQNAALLRAAEATSMSGFVTAPGLVRAELKSGEMYLGGDWINRHLIPEDGNKFSLFAFVAGAAMQSGVQEKDLPDYRNIAAYVVQSLGKPDFDQVRSPNGIKLYLSPSMVLKHFWTRITKLLQFPPPENMHVLDPPLSQLHWPILLSIAAANFIRMTKDTLSPAIGSRLVMEAAWIASKIYPEVVQPGNWHIRAEVGRLSIARLSA